MDNCRKFDEYFSDYVEGNLDPKIKEEAEKHLDNCYRCSTYVRRIQLLRSNLRSLTRHKTSESFEITLRGRLKREMRRGSLVERILPAVLFRRAPVYGVAAVLVLVGGYLAYQKFVHPQEDLSASPKVQEPPDLALTGREDLLQMSGKDDSLSTGAVEHVYYVIDDIPLEVLTTTRGTPSALRSSDDYILPATDSLDVKAEKELRQKALSQRIQSVTF